jgi:alpha-tubulin suppressor-like RCC1 family protein
MGPRPARCVSVCAQISLDSVSSAVSARRAPWQATPYIVSDLPFAAVQIAAAQYSSYALLDDGYIWAWGGNNEGQLGDGTTSDRSTPVRIDGYGADTAMQLPPGGVYAATMIVVLPDGTAKGSGHDNFLQLGSTFPRPAERQCSDNACPTAVALPGWGGGNVQFARGFDHTLVLKEE